MIHVIISKSKPCLYIVYPGREVWGTLCVTLNALKPAMFNINFVMY